MLEATLKWNGPKVAADMERRITVSLTEGAAIVEGQAAADAPVHLGNLRASINSAVERSVRFEGVAPGSKELGTDSSDIDARPREAIIGTAVFYGPYVEFGTRRMDPQPFLEPAFERNVDNIKRRFIFNLRGSKWVQ